MTGLPAGRGQLLSRTYCLLRVGLLLLLIPLHHARRFWGEVDAGAEILSLFVTQARRVKGAAGVDCVSIGSGRTLGRRLDGT